MTASGSHVVWTRRAVLAALGAASALLVLPAQGDDALTDAAIDAAFGSTPRADGRITLTLPPLAETGNTVPLKVSIDSPMSEADRVKRVLVFANRNPRALIAAMDFGPVAPKAQFETNIRLNGTQDVIAIAEMSDGSLWQTQTRVKVTVGACDTLQLRY